MYRTIICTIYSLPFLLILSSALSASDAVKREADYLNSAKRDLIQAEAFDKSPELVAAIKAIDNSLLLTKQIAPSAAEETSWLIALLPGLAVVAAFLAVGFLNTSRNSSSVAERGRGWFSNSKNTEHKIEELIKKMNHFVTDLSISDETILEMRDEARKLRKRR